jgi:hypothetical protein
MICHDPRAASLATGDKICAAMPHAFIRGMFVSRAGRIHDAADENHADYAPHFWKPVLLGSTIFVLVFFGGLGFRAGRR